MKSRTLIPLSTLRLLNARVPDAMTAMLAMITALEAPDAVNIRQLSGTQFAPSDVCYVGGSCFRLAAFQPGKMGGRFIAKSSLSS
ncbi:hypothetical protein KRR38_30030 [Novosphingobium sp. G106]|uniref:hypothetical protein n=1 Tax=Novosphingobium sp. G106 TaxID=2849500 RepID=UPI001C2CEE58|nr:hypothetical protein [Novosphingobium sp. G106]MBV1691803.1 hypothetical protein [Novosphingobium sp. G106]